LCCKVPKKFYFSLWLVTKFGKVLLWIANPPTSRNWKKIPCLEYQNCIKHNTKIGLDIAWVLKCSYALFITKAKLIFYLVVSNDEPHSNPMLARG
jgi:hypothetical protein